MYDIIVGLRTDVEMLKTAFGNALKVGPIEEIDPEKGYRLKLGEGADGQPYLSPWYPHPESGGQTSSWFPLSKGQIVGVMNPSGDARQGVMFRGGFSGENGAPSQDLAMNVLKALGIEISMKDGALTIKSEKVKIEADVEIVGNTDFKGGYVKSEGKHIDHTHIHGGVVRGGDVSDVPAN